MGLASEKLFIPVILVLLKHHNYSLFFLKFDPHRNNHFENNTCFASQRVLETDLLSSMHMVIKDERIECAIRLFITMTTAANEPVFLVIMKENTCCFENGSYSEGPT